MTGPFKFEFFQKDAMPDWRCPKCNRATLVPVPKSFKELRTARVHQLVARQGGLAPDDEEFVFTCLLVCSQKNCLQPVSVSGDGYLEQEWSGRYNEDSYYVSIYRPRHFYPPLSLFTPCDQYPDKIKEQLRELSAQLPGNPQAAVNALRTTLEIVLDNFDVPRKENNRYLSLDNRIKRIPTPYHYVQMGFMAMKWLGNTGSHNLQPVSPEDVEGACNMLDDFLQRIYRQPTDHSTTIARLTLNHDPNFKRN